mgnify:CR=1 FL=1
MFRRMIKAQTAKQEKLLERWIEKHDRENPFPKDVRMTENEDYLGDGKPCHRMDIFRPEGSVERLPVLVDIHGGGFLLGRKEANRLFCADMCKKGFVVFCPEYPLAPEAAVFDILSALSAGVDRSCELAEAHGGDASRLYLCGDSAGAYLCVYLAAMQNAPEMAEAAGVRPPKAKIRAIGLQSGMFYTLRLDKIGIFLPEIIYGKGWRKNAFRPYMDPENPELLRALPPCFLTTARGDFLRGYSRRFSAALQKRGVRHRLLDITGKEKLPHAFAAMLPETPEAQAANAEMAAFLKEQGL